MNKEKPIIFSTSMVKAILEGRKTMTRRVVKPQPPETHTVPFNNGGCWGFDPTIQNMNSIGVSMPYAVGGVLWVREAWRCNGVGKAGSIESALIEYKAGEGKTLDVDSERALYYAGK
ncbi:MAG: hypothetical protein LBQ88_05655, partial [Treponema sp.]|nr:hypothetical protein [Treponema sp.]